MTRETKAGLVVSCSFLCLVGVVLAQKLRDQPASQEVEETPLGVTLNIGKEQHPTDTTTQHEPPKIRLLSHEEATPIPTPTEAPATDIVAPASTPTAVAQNDPVPAPGPTPSPTPPPTPVPATPAATPPVENKPLEGEKKEENTVPLVTPTTVEPVVPPVNKEEKPGDPVPVPPGPPTAPAPPTNVVPGSPAPSPTPAPTPTPVEAVTPLPKDPVPPTTPTPVAPVPAPGSGDPIPVPTTSAPVVPVPVPVENKPVEVKPVPVDVPRPVVPAPGDLGITSPPMPGTTSAPVTAPAPTPVTPVTVTPAPVTPVPLQNKPEEKPLIPVPVAPTPVAPTPAPVPPPSSPPIKVVPTPVTPTPVVKVPDQPGQVLPVSASTAPIPVSPIGGNGPRVDSYDEQEHTVAATDTFGALSQKYYGSEGMAEALKLYNRNDSLGTGARDGDLKPGQLVAIPDKRILEKRYAHVIQGTPPATTPVPSVGQPPATPAPVKQVTFTVPQQGMSMYDIARSSLGNGARFGEIARLNPTIRPDYPVPGGTVLQMPADAKAQP